MVQDDVLLEAELRSENAIAELERTIVDLREERDRWIEERKNEKIDYRLEVASRPGRVSLVYCDDLKTLGTAPFKAKEMRVRIPQFLAGSFFLAAYFL